MMREQFNYFDVMSTLANYALLVREVIVSKVSISVLRT